MNTRRKLVYGVAAGVLAIALVYGFMKWQDPYAGLTLTEDVEITDLERSYVEQRIAVTRAALDSQAGSEDLDLDLFLTLAWDYTLIGNLVDARETYEEYFTHNAINYTAWANYGTILKKMGDIKLAEEAYLKAIEYNPTEGNYRNYVVLLRDYDPEGDREEEVLNVLNEGVARVGQTPWFMVAIAEWYMNDENCEEAFVYFELAMDLAPEVTAIAEDYAMAKAACEEGGE